MPGYIPEGGQHADELTAIEQWVRIDDDGYSLSLSRQQNRLIAAGDPLKTFGALFLNLRYELGNHVIYAMLADQLLRSVAQDI